MSLFLIGFCFAAAEHLVRSVVAHSFHYQPRQILTSLLIESPAFFAFAFVAGAGAEWLGDTGMNHSAQIIGAVVIWLLCLWIGAVVHHDLVFLRDCILRDDWVRWKLCVRVVALAGVAFSLMPYLVWHKEIRIELLHVVAVSVIVGSGYAVLVVKWSEAQEKWRTDGCKEDANTLFSEYVRKAPNDGTPLFENPNAHVGQDAGYYVSKYQVAYCEQLASKQCACLEDRLAERLGRKHGVAASAAKKVVREAAAVIASNCNREFYTLAYVVGTHPGYIRSRDILQKAGWTNDLSILDEMRCIVVGGSALLEIEIR